MKFKPEPKHSNGGWFWINDPSAYGVEPAYVERVRGKLLYTVIGSKDRRDGDLVTYGDELVAPEVTP